MEVATKQVEVKESKQRRRMKKLLNNIQQQMDFYFSDVNLNHDRFLRKEVEKDPEGYVELSTMLKFNKLKRLTSDVSVLAKAIENSSSLQLNNDRTKVMRTSKLRQLENVDSRTVYVEEFPTNVDHDWLKSIFTTCGIVNYISLPKYKHNNQVKGFAFVEFATSEEAQKACQVLNTVQKKESDGEKEPKKRRKRRSNSECSSNNGPTGGLQRQNSAKRRRSVSESSEGGSPAKSSRKRQTSFCSIVENEVERSSSDRDVIPSENKAVADTHIPTTTVASRRKKSRSRSRSISVSSDTDVIAAKVKNPLSKCFTDDAKNRDEKPFSKDTTGIVDSSHDSSHTSKVMSRKRKASKTLEKLDRNNLDQKLTKSVKNPTIEVPCTSVGVENKNISIKSGTHAEPVNDECTFTASCAAVQKNKDRKDSNLVPDDIKTSIRKRKSSVSEDAVPRKEQLLDSGTPIKDEYGKKGPEQGSHVKDDEIQEENYTKKKKKNRQHKKKEQKNCNEHPKVPPLHVIPKSEWMTLKKEYKRLQFTKMSELKKKLKVLKYEEVRRNELKERIFSSIAAKNEASNTDQVEEKVELEIVKCDREKENYDGTVDISEPKAIDKQKTSLELKSGTVAALKTSSENLTRNNIKETLSSFGEVAYVDYVDGVAQGFVRFVSAGDLDRLTATNDVEKRDWMFQLRKLQKDEEDEYFLRAEEKRLQKYEKGQRKRKKGRGVDKITRHIENAANHIHFS